MKELHRDAPAHGWQVPPQDPAPFEHQQAAEQHEQNEQQVKQHQTIGAQAVQHGNGFLEANIPCTHHDRGKPPRAVAA
ncbi:hypothetical protein D3C75_992930 [compost metagenome]